MQPDQLCSQTCIHSKSLLHQESRSAREPVTDLPRLGTDRRTQRQHTRIHTHTYIHIAHTAAENQRPSRGDRVLPSQLPLKYFCLTTTRRSGDQFPSSGPPSINSIVRCLAALLGGRPTPLPTANNSIPTRSARVSGALHQPHAGHTVHLDCMYVAHCMHSSEQPQYHSAQRRNKIAVST